MKINNKKGFTLVEVLVATAILLLVTMGLVVGVNAALKVYNNITVEAESETLYATLRTAISGELSQAQAVTEDAETGTIYWTSPYYGENVTMVCTGKNVNGQTKTVNCVMIKLTAGDEYGLVARDAYTSGLGANIDLSWDGEVFHVDLEIIDISGTVRRSGDITVRPLNKD